MDGERFDAVVRQSVVAATSRRGLLSGVLAGVLATTLWPDDSTEAASRRRKRRKRRRQRRRKVTLFHNGKVIRVAPSAVEAHLQHGDQLGTGGLEPGTKTCPNATLPCSTRLTACGGPDSDCFCFLTTTGGSFCANNGIECKAGTTCIIDDDCPDGYACVPTLGCGDSIPCSNTSNACAAPCQA